MSHVGGVEQAAVHSETVLGPANIRYRGPGRCLTQELHLLVLDHRHIPSRDVDCSTFWEKKLSQEQTACLRSSDQGQLRKTSES